MNKLVLILTALLLTACTSTAEQQLTTHAQTNTHVADRTDGGHPVATPIPVPIPAVPQPVTAPLRPVNAPVRLRVVGPGVDVGVVGSYTDCTGRAPVGWSGAYFDTCQPGTWIMAHPPFFGAMNSWSVGTAVTWYDSAGNAHLAHVIANRVFPSGSGGFTVSGWLHLQVCTANVANSSVRVLDAA
jgi:hypothetical protein